MSTGRIVVHRRLGSMASLGHCCRELGLQRRDLQLLALALRQVRGPLILGQMFDFLRRRRGNEKRSATIDGRTEGRPTGVGWRTDEWFATMGWRVVRYCEGLESLFLRIIPMASGADLVYVPTAEIWQQLAPPVFRDRRDEVLARLKAVPWSRSLDWKNVATEFQSATPAPGTVESTPGGTILESLNMFAPGCAMPFDEARETWIKASRMFATAATGKVDVPADQIEAVPNSVFEVVVLPTLRENPNITLEFAQQDNIVTRAGTEIVRHFLVAYGGAQGGLRPLDAVSALGAVAGALAHVQARTMLAAGTIPWREGCLLTVETKDGRTFWLGDAINACVFESIREQPSLWDLIGAVARGWVVDDEADFPELAGHTVSSFGGPEFGIPRLPDPYKLTEMPINAVRAHASILRKRLREVGLLDAQLVHAFGAAAQTLISIAAGETRVRVAEPLPHGVSVRLLMESAIPMSKLDLTPLISSS
jgi:hypothetical protein